MSDDDDQEPLDPRIQLELEKLNKASLLINKLENDLDDARVKFRTLLTESTHQLESLSKRLGSCIEKAKLYYDCRLRAKEVQVQTIQAATKYERAMSLQSAAREMVELAEQGYKTKKPSFDMAWQEMLNHATMKVMNAESERVISEGEHHRMTKLYAHVQEEVNLQYKENKRNIAKSKTYYEMKAEFHTSLESQKSSIESLQNDVSSAKQLYSKALKSLEDISEEIHHNRIERKASKKLGERGTGVGSESPRPPPFDEHLRSTTNNNHKDLDQETEIIISYPPVRTKAKDLSLNSLKTSQSNTESKTVSAIINDSDQPVDISGIKIDVIPAGVRKTLIKDDNSKLPNLPLINVTKTDIVTDSPDKDSDSKSCASNSNNSSPVVLRHRRVPSGSLQLCAKRLLHETSSIDSDTGSVKSLVVLDDEGVVSAMSDQYFDGSFEAELRKSTHGDYSKLPESLSRYQRPYEVTRNSYPLLEDADLKLDQVLKLLESSNDESIV